VHRIDSSVPLTEQLDPLRPVVEESRIVLLGENGHGVGSLTKAKVEVATWLLEDSGFDLLVFESGFFECGHADRRPGLSAREALYACLRYPFQHAEGLPLFQAARPDSHGRRPFRIEGMDIQAQGFDSEPRPGFSRRVLGDRDPELAARVASLDTLLFLVEDQGGLGDSLYTWAAAHGDSARRVLGRAAAASEGWDRWVFETARGWVHRLAARGEAPAGVPARYYELRDEWMARAVAAHADSIAGSRRVVVWLHNDHARYGTFESPGGPARSVGSYLREWYGDEVVAVGFFMGEGEVADNGRKVRPTDSLPADGIEAFLRREGAPASLAVLRGAGDPLRSWAEGERPYLRMGLERRTLIPAEEFDALIYVDTATVPTYDIPDPR
jgi:erythromycin esterase